MATHFLIKGGKRLRGTIDVYGSKNAALPIIASTLLTKEPCIISNVPRVTDVHLMIDALNEMGAKILWKGWREVVVENQNIDPRKLNRDIVKKMRASILFCGPLVARFGEVRNMHYPGGCSIGSRPIDVHLRAFTDLGADVTRGKKNFSIYAKNRVNHPTTVILDEFSVTATENILIFASALPVKTIIKIAATEPHVSDLAKFLSRMGAKVRGAGTSHISVRGTTALTGARHRIISDYIEAGTFMLMALAAGGEVCIKNAPIEHLDLVIKKLITSGANIACDYKKKSVLVKQSNQHLVLKKVQTMLYPGIPTDLQSAFGVFATRTFGETLIHEPLYEKRLECLNDLTKMGARIKILDPHRAIVWGPTHLTGAEVSGYDLRSTAALIIAGLSAKGTTAVYGAEYAERGYENLEGRLRMLGADIKRVS